VSPTGADDDQAGRLEAAGYQVLRQGRAYGLTHLWNAIYRRAAVGGYAALVVANNDLLWGHGALDRMVEKLDRNGVGIVVPMTTELGAGSGLAVSGFYNLTETTEAYVDEALNYNRIATALDRLPRPLPEDGAVPRPVFVGFCFAVSMGFAGKLELADGNLWNGTMSQNFGQEGQLVQRINDVVRFTDPDVRKAVNHIALAADAFVFHFRGSTLGGCKNGHKLCAAWQEGHRVDAWSKGSRERAARRSAVLAGG